MGRGGAALGEGWPRALRTVRPTAPAYCKRAPVVSSTVAVRSGATAVRKANYCCCTTGPPYRLSASSAHALTRSCRMGATLAEMELAAVMHATTRRAIMFLRRRQAAVDSVGRREFREFRTRFTLHTRSTLVLRQFWRLVSGRAEDLPRRRSGRVVRQWRPAS